MATVTTPSGHVLEGVAGSALEYYQGLANVGEAYVVDESAPDAPSPVSEPVVEQVEVAPPTEVLPEGQYRATDGIVYDSATQAPVDPQPEPPSA